MPRLVLAAHTIGTCRAASRTALSSAPCSPVVPITIGLAEPRRQLGMLGRRVGGGELDRDVAVAQQRFGAVSRGYPEPADAGQFAEILSERRAARPRRAARQGATVGSSNVGDQHTADPAGTSDHPDPGLRHRRLPRLGADSVIPCTAKHKWAEAASPCSTGEKLVAPQPASGRS